MILFIIIEIAILLYTIFADDWLTSCIREDMHSAIEIIKDIGAWFGFNIIFAIGNALIVWTISFFIFFGCVSTQPSIESEWSFNINALKDNLVTEGSIHGSMFGVRGYVDGELSYFYSRTMSKGEIIEHIPADKTYIRYDNKIPPRVEVHESQLDVPELISKIFWVDCFNDKQLEYYTIVVPEGTISNSGTYQIDMR